MMQNIIFVAKGCYYMSKTYLLKVMMIAKNKTFFNTNLFNIYFNHNISGFMGFFPTLTYIHTN